MGRGRNGAGRGGRASFTGETTMTGMPNVPSKQQLERDPRARRSINVTISADEQIRTKHADMLDAGNLGRAYVAAYRASYENPARRISFTPINRRVTDFTNWTPTQQRRYFTHRAHTDAVNDLHEMALSNAGYPF